MVLVKAPLIFVLYLTTMVPSLPLSIGCLGHVGVVQPHDAFTLVNNKGSLPVFLKVNSQVPSLLYLISP